jgi:8-oxo-dGTP diphosphatase
VPIDQLQSYRFPAANLPVIKAVDLPECYLITPEPGGETARFLVELERSLELGVSLLQLRARQLPDNDYRALIPEVLQRCQQANARLLLNTDPRLASEFGAAGVHLSSERLMATSSHPGARTLGFSGFHDLTERASIPVYALGGMQVVDLPIAFRHGGQGIAAIRGLWNQTLTVQIGR